MTSKTTKRSRQLLPLKVLELRALGRSLSEISQDLGIGIWRVRHILDGLNSEMRESLLTDFISQRVPLMMSESLELNRLIIRKSWSIFETQTEGRVKIECLRLINQVNKDSQLLLSDSAVIAKAIQRSGLVLPMKKQATTTTTTKTDVDDAGEIQPTSEPSQNQQEIELNKEGVQS